MAAKVQGAPPAIANAPAELPPGFRFHPTDEELVNFYLRRKILLQVHDFIPDVDLYKCEPWDLADKTFSPSRDDPGADGPQVECYLFGPRDQKYANGLRKNRATPAGFWKSTGKDRPVMHHHMDAAIGMKKTLVYHLGRAPKGVRTDWVMHEYRLHHHDMMAIQDNYTLCRIFKKKATASSPDGTYVVDKDSASMQFVPSGADADKDDSWPRMQLDADDAWNFSTDSYMDDSWMQYFSTDYMDDSWIQSVLDPEQLVAAAGPNGEAADVEVARVDDGAAGRGAEEGGQEEDAE